MGDDEQRISRVEVVRLLGVEEEFLVHLEREQIVSREADAYAPATVERIRICHTLHAELGVNLAGIEVALQLLDTIHSQRSQFQSVLGWLRKQLAEQSDTD